ncbi:glycerophosphocholine phosphodiesterase GPCPD1-like [Episyrphus balteatus]|uniref:glycerophosphocholine phosphodiesterase GPCPD1-like n=1 Tax=Episyrphus balteatus TaxID=286459 RepID=UPI002485C5BA|nr:glycerophosphocholine phosphodiesterase GPCPD1-like [Episyrphus balteatus]
MAKNSIVLTVLIALVASSKGFRSDSDFSKMYNRIPGWRPAPKLQWNFSVELDQPLKPYEKLGITGDADFLGSWSPNKALILNRTELATTWAGSVRVPANSTVNYRYFIGVVDSIGGVQIRKWETHLDGRTVKLGVENIGTTDRFGIVEDRKEINRGWLNSGHILQFKLFRNPIQLNGLNVDRRIFVKITPVDYDWSAKEKLLTPIVASGRANIEFIRMQYGNSKIRDQPEYGVPYEIDDIVMFHVTTNDLKNVAYKFTIFVQDERKPEMIHTLGYQYLYPESIDGTDGSTELVLMSANWLSSIGTIKVGYLLIKPLSTTQVNFKTTFAHHWRKNWTALDAGHRGLGKSLKLGAEAPSITENTVASMKEAGVQGADIVEFDVQLTSDLIPIIYHDFFVYVCMNAKTPTSKEDLTQVLIKDLTYEQLKALKTYQVIDSKIIEYPAHNLEPREDYRLFPLFEDFLTKVNHSIGFDIEIKWPQLRFPSGKFESIQTIDKNLYIDRILDVMLRKGCGRLSFFTSFDADICTLLQFKQNMYPVMFLGPSIGNSYIDPRSDNFKQTINNAKAMGLLGVVPHSSNFVKDGNLVKLATDLNLKIFIWGDDSSSTEMVDYFKSFGPTGVVYDRIDLWVPDGKANVFSQEDDLPEFFKKQCSYRNATEAISI